MADPSHDRRRRNYKLLVDPALKQGQVKLYRFDGYISGNTNPVIIKDPRGLSNRYHIIPALDLPVPKFKIDQNYIGPLPPKEVTFASLSEHVTQNVLGQLCKNFGVLDEVKVFHHPASGRHLGIGMVSFASARAAKECASKLNSSFQLGQSIRAFTDHEGKKRKRIVEKLVENVQTEEGQMNIHQQQKHKPPEIPHHGPRPEKPKIIPPESVQQTTHVTPHLDSRGENSVDRKSLLNKVDSLLGVQHQQSPSNETDDKAERSFIFGKSPTPSSEPSPVDDEYQPPVRHSPQPVPAPDDDDSAGPSGNFKISEESGHAPWMQIDASTPSPVSDSQEEGELRSDKEDKPAVDLEFRSESLDSRIESLLKFKGLGVTEQPPVERQTPEPAYDPGQPLSIIDAAQAEASPDKHASEGHDKNLAETLVDQKKHLTGVLENMYQLMSKSGSGRRHEKSSREKQPTPRKKNFHELAKEYAKTSTMVEGHLTSQTFDKLMDELVVELKHVLRRDLQRKVIESAAYKGFDDWWAKQEFKMKPEERSGWRTYPNRSKFQSHPHAQIPPLLAEFKPPLADMVEAPPVSGLFGIKGVPTIQSLPSFKKKPKPPSPLKPKVEVKPERRDDRPHTSVVTPPRPQTPLSESESEHSGDDENINAQLQQIAKRRQAPTKAQVFSSSSSLSSSDSESDRSLTPKLGRPRTPARAPRTPSPGPRTPSPGPRTPSHRPRTPPSPPPPSTEIKIEDEPMESDGDEKEDSKEDLTRGISLADEEKDEEKLEGDTAEVIEEEAVIDDHEVLQEASSFVANVDVKASPVKKSRKKTKRGRKAAQPKIVTPAFVPEEEFSDEEDKLDQLIEDVIMKEQDEVVVEPRKGKAKGKGRPIVEDDEDEAKQESDDDTPSLADVLSHIRKPTSRRKGRKKVQQKRKTQPVVVKEEPCDDEPETDVMEEEPEIKQEVLEDGEIEDDHEMKLEHVTMDESTVVDKEYEVPDVLQVWDEHCYFSATGNPPVWWDGNDFGIIHEEVVEDVPSVSMKDDRIPATKERKPTKRKKKTKAELARERADTTRINRELASILEPVRKSTEIIEPPKPVFPRREVAQEFEILHSFRTSGVDEEDLAYLRQCHEVLIATGEHKWVRDTHWVEHPTTFQPDEKKASKRRKTEKGTVHRTGCARAEGYYVIAEHEKRSYLKSSTTPPKPLKISRIAEPKIRSQFSRDARFTQRRLVQSVMVSNADFFLEQSELFKLNTLQLRKKQMKFAKSSIHDFGLYALETIPAGEMVVEYVGQLIRASVAEIREKRYEAIGLDSSYLFRIDYDMVIDATKHGNLARFINHSCTPNCIAKVITVESQKKIVIYSKCQINVGEEITYDYKFPIEDEKIPCLCGSASCRGFLN